MPLRLHARSLLRNVSLLLRLLLLWNGLLTLLLMRFLELGAALFQRLCDRLGDIDFSNALER